MKESTIRYYLHIFKTLNGEIEDKLRNLEQYRDMGVEDFIFPANGNQNSESQRSKYSKNSPTENISIPRLELIKQQENEIFKLKTIQCAISIVTRRHEASNDTEYQILQLRYFDKKKNKSNSWNDIAVELGYSDANIKKMDSVIVEEINKEIFIQTVYKHYTNVAI